MPSLRRPADHLLQAAADLAWSLWSECGVSSWDRPRHAAWQVELEPLLVLTAYLAPHDPRLLREAVDWCVTNERFISLTQLRRVITNERWPFKGEIAAFGATVGMFTRRRWPGVSNEKPLPLSLSKKSVAPDLQRPALLALRLRALFGVSARAEIVRALVARPSLSVRQIAECVAYTRRQVASDLEMLVASGVVVRSSWTTPTTYDLSDRTALLGVIGDLPEWVPPWAPLLRVLTGLIDAFHELEAVSLRVPAAELRRRLRLLEPTLTRARLNLPPPSAPDRDLPALTGWATETFEALAIGDPTPLHPNFRLSKTLE